MKWSVAILSLFLFFSFLLNVVHSDLPVHCEFPQIRGTWTFLLSSYSYSKDIVNNHCQLNSPFPSNEVPLFKTKKISLGIFPDRPDIAIDEETKEIGLWTLTYDQSFEITFRNFRYFAFFNYTTVNVGGKQTIISHCNQTFTGWFNEIQVGAPRFGCLRATLSTQTSLLQQTTHVYDYKEHYSPLFSHKRHQMYDIGNKKLLQVLSSSASPSLSWRAGAAHFLLGKTVQEVQKMMGTPVATFRRTAHRNHMSAMRKLWKSREQEESITFSKRVAVKMNDAAPQKLKLPKQFDWRNVSGTNYVSPVRSQGSCGSCYAFASTAMFEARLLVQTDAQQLLILSPQDVVECSPFSQGCEGGFPELVTKFGEAWGIALEKYNPYTGVQNTCHKGDYDSSFARLYTTNYFYVGPDGNRAYYGASTEEGVIINLLEKGPVAVSIEVYPDFLHYKDGVYRHVNETEQVEGVKVAGPDPQFVITNHVILIVGYGETEDGDKYWIIKNSWGTKWGNNGFGWIARGTDEVSIESMPISADIVMNYNWNF